MRVAFRCVGCALRPGLGVAHGLESRFRGLGPLSPAHALTPESYGICNGESATTELLIAAEGVSSDGREVQVYNRGGLSLANTGAGMGGRTKYACIITLYMYSHADRSL